VAISSRCKHFINTDCFEQVLNRIWSNKLSHADRSFFWYLKFAISLLTFGFLAPFFLPYFPGSIMETDDVQNEHENNDQKVSILKSENFLKSIIQ
jgi:hypothetical protein